MSEAQEKARAWSKNPSFNEDFRNEIKTLISENQTEELEDRFYKDLEFGTGGMRGVIGAGSNRINRYTIRKATQGLATYILKNSPGENSVAIAYDSRRQSRDFAREAASVLVGNGVKAFLFPNLHPTPLLSHAVRQLKATAGIVITASHNPPEYNGYKVYWREACQVTAPHDQGIIAEVDAVPDFGSIKSIPFEEAFERGEIAHVPESLDGEYLDGIEAQAFGDVKTHGDFPFLYTPLHGTGRDLVRKLMMRRGFLNFRIVPSQEFPDENFSTLAKPNPEEPEAYAEALKFANGDDRLIIATDPDADRIGVMVRDGQGNWVRLNGNQIGQLLFDYKINKLAEAGQIPENGFIVSTVVTSELIKSIASEYNVKTYETLTGFKFIGNVTHRAVENGERFLFGCEESHGYQFEDFIREKDGVSAALYFAEMAAEYWATGRTPLDRLEEIHRKFGFREDDLVNVRIPGPSGAEKIRGIIKKLRENPPAEIAGSKVVEIRDYLERTQTRAGQATPLPLEGFPKENLIAFFLEDGTRVSARPSGTEPLIKFYFNLCGNDPETLQKRKNTLVEKFSQIIESF